MDNPWPLFLSDPTVTKEESPPMVNPQGESGTSVGKVRVLLRDSRRRGARCVGSTSAACGSSCGARLLRRWGRSCYDAEAERARVSRLG
ncbi:hypothetical protein GOBAR_DD14045 [Gossypium barbadense]|nr:hypothetical protein GOBAR_DD14045 [Gossypium barbadense]